MVDRKIHPLQKGDDPKDPDTASLRHLHENIRIKALLLLYKLIIFLVDIKSERMTQSV